MRVSMWVLAILVGLPFLSGCAAMQNLSAKDGPKVFGGTRVDAALMSGKAAADADPAQREKIEPPVVVFAAFCGLVDMPLSFIADTAMLPVTVPLAIERNKVESKKEVEKPNSD